MSMTRGWSKYNSAENNAGSDCECNCRDCRQGQHEECDQDCKR